MEDLYVYFRCSILCFLLGCTFDFGFQNVHCLERHKPSRCFTNDNTYTIDLKCKNNTWIHVIKETYSKSKSNDTCQQADDNCTREAEDNRVSSKTKLQTDCNGKSECTEILYPAYFNCLGRRMATVEYKCIPESINYNICGNLTATSNKSDNILYLRSPVLETSTSHMMCSCTVQGKNIQVHVTDFLANTKDDHKWSLNITSYNQYLNDSILSINTARHLLNNVLGGFHELVRIEYDRQNTNNQSIWIQLKGHRNSSMNLTCISRMLSNNWNITDTPKSTSAQPTTATETSTNTNNTPTFTNTTYSTSTVPPSDVSTSSPSTGFMSSSSTEMTTNTSGGYSSVFTSTTSDVSTSSPSTGFISSSSTEMTTNTSGGYSSNKSESDQETMIISAVVVPVGLVIIAIIIAVCVIYIKRKNRLKSLRDHLSPKNNRNMYFDINYSSDTNEQKQVSDDYTEINLDDNEPTLFNNVIVSPRHSKECDNSNNVYWTVEPHINGGSESEPGDFKKCDHYHGTMDNNYRKGTLPFVNHDTAKEFKDQHAITPKSSSKCVPEEDMEDNSLYNVGITKCHDTSKCVPDEEMEMNPVYNMEDTSKRCISREETAIDSDKEEQKPHPKCVPDEDMEINSIYYMEDSKQNVIPKEQKESNSDVEELEHHPKCVPDEEMEINEVYYMEDNKQKDISLEEKSSNSDEEELDFHPKCVPDEEMETNPVYGMMGNTQRTIPQENITKRSINSDEEDSEYDLKGVPQKYMEMNPDKRNERIIPYNVDNNESSKPEDKDFQDSPQCVPEEDMENNSLYSMDVHGTHDIGPSQGQLAFNSEC